MKDFIALAALLIVYFQLFRLVYQDYVKVTKWVGGLIMGLFNIIPIGYLLWVYRANLFAEGQDLTRYILTPIIALVMWPLASIWTKRDISHHLRSTASNDSTLPIIKTFNFKKVKD